MGVKLFETLHELLFEKLTVKVIYTSPSVAVALVTLTTDFGACAVNNAFISVNALLPADEGLAPAVN